MKKAQNEFIYIAIKNLFTKITAINIDKASISDYNKRYLKEYYQNYHFFMSLYKQLFEKIISKLSKPISESCFVDYGGGCGILSFLAIELGFKNVIYNDIYEVSVKDARTISELIDAPINHFIPGDVQEFTTHINTNNIQIDVLASFDVLEHIYDLEDWFTVIKTIPRPFLLSFMTSANAKNPYIRRKLKKIHYKAEYIGSTKAFGWKERDTNEAFLTIREKMIAKKWTNLDKKQSQLLARNTRGLYGDAIFESVKRQLTTKEFQPTITHPTNTCDPLTGNWAEHSIDLKYLRSFIEDTKTTVQFSNSFYSYSKNTLLNIPKYFLNKCMKLFGKQNLFLSPSYTLEVEFKD